MSLEKAVRSQDRILGAWARVRANGLRSQSTDTRAQIRDYEKEVHRHLRRIIDHLRQRRFDFGFGRGVPVERDGKDPRPLVVTSVECRIVQRAILDLLAEQPGVWAVSTTSTSFGAVPEGGVGPAIKRLNEEIARGNRYFIRTDIKDFFPHMPRKEILADLERLVPGEPRFLWLTDLASTTRLSNAQELGSLVRLFPNSTTGMPQGCALSPLFGNIHLHEFDNEFNARGVVCLRYLDDFVLLSDSTRRTRKAFEAAAKHLRSRGYEVYDPETAVGKASVGDACEGIEFLGCEIYPGLIRPNKQSRRSILGKIEEALREGQRALPLGGRTAIDPNHGVGPTLQGVRQLVQSWRGQYDFCTDKQAFCNLDTAIAESVSKYLDQVQASRRATDAKVFMQVLGIPCMSD